jgi:hypothetical protein
MREPQEIADEEYEQILERVAAIDVARRRGWHASGCRTRAGRASGAAWCGSCRRPPMRSWSWWFDTQAFPASGADVDGAEPAILDTLHDGLAGDAEARVASSVASQPSGASSTNRAWMAG